MGGNDKAKHSTSLQNAGEEVAAEPAPEQLDVKEAKAGC